MSVLCVGQIVADIVVRPVNNLPAPGTMDLVEDLQLVTGGCAANTASVLAKLGVKTAIAGAVGSDSLGEAMVANLAGFGVDVSHVVHDESSATSAVVVVVDSSGERSFLYRQGSNEKLRVEWIKDEALRAANHLHIGGGMKLHNLDLAELLSRAKAAGCTTSFDTDWDASGRWLAILEGALTNVDYLLTNEEEGGMMTGLKGAEEIGKSLLKNGPKVVVVKRGENGSVVVTNEFVKTVAPFRVNVLDTTCAGDSFAAGFVYGMSHGWDIDETMKFANAVGAICTTKISHLGITSFDDTVAFIRDYSKGDLTVSEPSV